jgi:hypothetical protein
MGLAKMALVLVAQPVSYARLTPAPCMFDAGILNTAHHIEMSRFFSWGPISTVPTARVEMQFVQCGDRANWHGDRVAIVLEYYADVCFAV